MVQCQKVQQQLRIPYEQPAVALLIENFVLDLPHAKNSRGFLAGLLPLLRTTASDSLLSNTVDAVGLCFLSGQAVNESIASRATKSYVHALRRLQSALYDDIDGISTETMISVFLMGLYEMMVPPKETLHPWVAHLQGLTTMMEARRRTGSLKAFSDGSSFATDSSPGKSTPAIDHDNSTAKIPRESTSRDEGTPHSEQGTSHALETRPFANWFSMNAALEDLIPWTQPVLQTAPAVLARRHHGAHEDVVCVLTAARSRLSSFKSWASRIPDHCQPRTINHQIPSSEIFRLDIFPGTIDVYPDLHRAAVWNAFRTILLRLCDLIAQCGCYLENDSAPFQETEEYQMLRATAKETSEDICASVAYHINNDWISGMTGSQTSPKALGGLCLVWPLYAGSILSIVPDTLRRWMRRKLRSIGVSMGIAQAVVLADTVDIRSRTNPLKTLVIAQGQQFMRSASML